MYYIYTGFDLILRNAVVKVSVNDLFLSVFSLGVEENFYSEKLSQTIEHCISNS